MNSRARAIFEGQSPERVWLLEHPPLYTLGTSAHADDVLKSAPFPQFSTGRGGQVTYHGPGQRIAYVQLNLKNRGQDIRAYVFNLEEWIIRTLQNLGITAERRPGRVGIWVEKGGRDHKIAAIGVRVQKWVTLHGIALNNTPDLSHFHHIIPCGLKEYGVTSLEDMGVKIERDALDQLLKQQFYEVFSV